MFKMIKKILDQLLEILLIVIVIALVVVVLLQVLIRFAPVILDIIPLPPLIDRILRTGTEEVAVFMLIWVSLLGSAVALGRGAHLGIDYFVGKLPAKIRIYTEVFVFLVVALFSFLVMIVGGTELVIRTLQLEQISPAINVKVGYVYLAIPISGFFLVLYSLIGLVERFVELFKGKVIVELPTSSHTEKGIV